MIFGFYLGEQVIVVIGVIMALYFLYRRFWAGLAMGLGLLTKHSLLFLGFGLAVGLALPVPADGVGDRADDERKRGQQQADLGVADVEGVLQIPGSGRDGPGVGTVQGQHRRESDARHRA